MLIRLAAANDVDKLKKLLQLLSQETPPIALDLGWALDAEQSYQRWFYASFNPTVSRDSGAMFLATQKTSILGFCYIIVPKPRFLVGHVGIAVEKPHRGKGVGSELLTEATKFSNSMRLRALIADIWSENKPSLAFFKQNGFHEEKKWLENFKGTQQEKVRLVKLLSRE